MPAPIVAFFFDALKMKELQNTFILAICLLAFTTVVFFFKYGRERAQSKALEAENMASQTLVFDMEKKAERRAKEAERLSKIARQSAEENMRRVQQAREMLEKSKRQSELTQMELVKNLNSQLEREADARIAAEKASKELQKQRDILRIAVEDAKTALDDLKKRGAEGRARTFRARARFFRRLWRPSSWKNSRRGTRLSRPPWPPTPRKPA